VENEDLNDLFCSPNIIWVIKSRSVRQAGHVACVGERRGEVQTFWWGKRPFGRRRHKWDCNIKIYLQEVGCGGVDWIDLTQDRDSCQALVNAIMNLWVP